MHGPFRRILLATDGSGDAAPAARAATCFSNRTAAELHLVQVWDPVLPPPRPTPAFDAWSRSAREEARGLLRREEWRARVAGGRVAGTHLREGPPAGEILALAERLGADLIVVGSHRAGPVLRLVKGGVSRRVARRAPCPVLVVRGERWPPKRVVVADEGSEPSTRAGDLSAEIAGLFGADLVLVRAYEHPPMPVVGWSAGDRRELDEMLLRNRRELQGRAERLEERARCRPKTRLVRSSAAAALDLVARETAGEQPLLAIGGHGRGAQNAVLGTSDGPVLVVPARAPVAPWRGQNVSGDGAPRRPAAARTALPYASWWVLAREGNSTADLLTVSGARGRVLPAFSHEEEAQMFLWFEGVRGNRWRVRETPAGELASLLLGPHADVGGVALDPLPGMADAGTIELVEVDRKGFVRLLVADANTRRAPASGRPRGSAWRGALRARLPNRRPS